MYKKSLIIALITGVTFACQKESSPTPVEPPRQAPADFIRGADISFFPEIEAASFGYLDRNGQAKDLLSILRDNGVNTIRLRLWHTPATAHSGLAEVKALSARIKSGGFRLWLDIHYSDTWADPGHQAKPAAWNGLSVDLLSDSVYNYTRKVVGLLQPDIVQIGNEINAGFLWPEGSNANAAQFTSLLKRAIQAVNDLPAPNAKVMIHYAGPDDNVISFYSVLTTNNVPFDLVGISYYPAWHTKSMTTVNTVLIGISQVIKKNIVIAETAYPFTLGYNDFTFNNVGSPSQLIPEYPATPDGQKAFLNDLKNMVIQNSMGQGIAYWAPEWVAFDGPTSTKGSGGENLALFDFTGKALPAIEVFKKE
jgi:arabinogalactan endo-1,4-beta-galactosidase